MAHIRTIPHPLRRLIPLGLLLGIVLALPRALPAVVPPNFVDELILDGVSRPTDVAFLPDGRIFISEKQGRIKVFKNGSLLAASLIDLTDEVGGNGNRGLLSFTLDPNFASNHFIYLLYCVDPVFGVPDEPSTAVAYSRLARYTVAGDLAVSSSRKIIMGQTAADGLPLCRHHATGRLRFGIDGKLWLSVGDGAHDDFMDDGTNVTAEDPGCEGMFGAAQDFGAYRSQLLTSLNGKILRVDPVTGLGLADNPFYDGSLASVRSRVWALGLRNAFRFCFKPGTSTLYITENGWSTWEELNVARAPGLNFGWPCYEGTLPQPTYQAGPIIGPLCQGAPSGTLTAPLITWNHTDPGTVGFVGNSSTGSVFYDAANFPAHYSGACFFADYGQGWIKAAFVNANDQLIAIEDFASGLNSPMHLELDPQTGGLVYISIDPGQVRRIRYTAQNEPPVVEAAAFPAGGAAPFVVHFSSDGTSDPDGDPLTFEWDFGDGTPPSPDPNPVHLYQQPGDYVATLTVHDTHSHQVQASIPVSAINTPPEASITNPPGDYRFTTGDVLQFAAEVWDEQDGTSVSYNWEVELIHNNHLHPQEMASDEAIPPPYTLLDHGTAADRIAYRVILQVTDTGGLSTADARSLLPINAPPNQPPDPAILASPLSGIVPLTVGFSAFNSIDPDGDFMFYEWNFGDGATGSGATTSHTFSILGDYDVALTASDVWGGSNQAIMTIHASSSAPPTIAINSSAQAVTNLSPIPVSVTFSEPVTGFDAWDVVASNALVQNFSGSGANYAFALLPTSQGLITADISAGAAVNIVGTASAAAPQFSRFFDSVSPTVSMSSIAAANTNLNSIPVTVGFNEPVANFIAADVVPTNATVAAFSGSGASYSFDLIPLAQGAVRAGLNAGVATDAAGNGNTAATQFSRTFDSLAPTAEIFLVTPNPTNADFVTFDVDFAGSLASGTFTAADITVNGLASSVQVLAVQPGTVYPVKVTMTNPNANGTVSITLGTQIFDLAGNAFAGMTSAAYTISNGPTPTPTATPTPTPTPSPTPTPTAGPTVSMTSTTTANTNVSPIPVSVVFSAPATGFVASDIVATNATVGAFSGSGANYGFTLTPLAQGTVTANVPPGVAVDSQSRGNQAAPQFSRTYDSIAPKATIVLTDPNPTALNAVHFNVDFEGSLQSGSFSAADITVVGLAGTVAVGPVQPGTVYPVTVTLTNPNANGTVRIAVGTQVFDLAGNPFAGLTSAAYTISN